MRRLWLGQAEEKKGQSSNVGPLPPTPTIAAQGEILGVVDRGTLQSYPGFTGARVLQPQGADLKRVVVAEDTHSLGS